MLFLVFTLAEDVVNYFVQKTDISELKRLEASIEIKMEELGILLEDLENRFATIEHERSLQITRKNIIAFVGEFIRGDLMDKDFQERIIKNLVNIVYVYDDKWSCTLT